MNFFDILSMDERVLVYSSEEDQMIFTWNKSITLQCWTKDIDRNKSEDYWREVDVQVLSEEPDTFEAARKAAISWSCSGSKD